jgi:hypothetical protein
VRKSGDAPLDEIMGDKSPKNTDKKKKQTTKSAASKKDAKK